VDLIAKDAEGGNEVVRRILNEGELLDHLTNLPKQDPVIGLAMDAVKAQALAECGEAGQLTLGEFLAKLENAYSDAEVVFEDGKYAGTFRSYRGYYDHLALSRSDEPKTAGLVHMLARDAVGQTYKGYKGGAFTMTKMTPLWAAEYGEGGDRIVDVTVTRSRVLIHTKPEEE
jgi:hypothetical protein